jgi:hypothetical protein
MSSFQNPHKIELLPRGQNPLGKANKALLTIHPSCCTGLAEFGYL